MHELSVTQAILDLVVETARQSGAERVVAVDLAIGDLSSVVDDSVQFYFDLLSRGTLAEGAMLRFRREPAQLRCHSCGQTSAIGPPLPFACPACGSDRLQISGGQSFCVDSIEVTDEDSDRAGHHERE